MPAERIANLPAGTHLFIDANIFVSPFLVTLTSVEIRSVVALPGRFSGLRPLMSSTK